MLLKGNQQLVGGLCDKMVHGAQVKLQHLWVFWPHAGAGAAARQTCADCAGQAGKGSSSAVQGDRCILTIDCQAGELTSTHEAGVLWAQASGLGHLRPQLANVRVPVAVHGLAQDALHLHRQQPALAAVLMGQTPQPRLALQCMQQA